VSDRRFRPTWPSDISRDVDDELAAHVDERRQEYVARGLDPDAAAAAAARRFGNRDAVADVCRRIDRGAMNTEKRRHMLADLRQDLAYGLRLFRRSPGFAAIAIVTLVLGMGATTTMFTLANWALLRPVPGVSDPANVGIVWVGTFSDRGSFSVSSLSYPNLADISARLRTIAIGGYQQSAAPVSGGGQAARNLSIQHVTASYFDVLGVRMQIGRPFTAAEDAPPAPFLGAVISDRLWQSVFQRSPAVLDQRLDVAGITFAILGVAGPGFQGTERLSTTDVWLPGASQAVVRRMTALRYDTRDGAGFYELVARLRPGASWGAAQAELDTLRAWLREEYPQENGKFARDGLHVMGPIGPHPLGRRMMERAVGLTTFGASALVMLIACANVAGLLTIKGLGRRQETAVRKALGAGRGRLLRQHVVEGLLLWAAGGAGALALLLLLRRALNIPELMGMGTLDALPPIDWRVLGFTAAVSLVIGIAFSAVPAIRATRTDAAETMRVTSHAVTSRRFVGTSLAVFQLGAALTLLVGALLLAGTLRHFAAVPLGFDTRGLSAFFVTPRAIGYGEAESISYVEEFQRRLRNVAGVRSVSASRAAPFFGSRSSTRILAADAHPQARPFEPNTNYVFDAGYFDTLGIPIVRGRAFADSDIAAGRRGQSRAVILTQGLAQRLFGDADPIGREVTFPVLGRKGDRYVVIGVAGTARYRSLITSEADDLVYEPAASSSAKRDVVLIARSTAGVNVANEARRIAAELNASLPLMLVQSMDDAVDRALRDWNSLARLLGILAGLAAVLAAIGLYGVVAHGVAERRREFGIRAALGASRGDVWRLVLRQSATIVGAGVALGLAGAYAFAQVLSARLVGVSPLDPGLWSIAVIALVVAACAASLKPAIAASRVEITETLRAL
jgi:predicted permease